MKCPRQDSRYWKPGAIFEARCPECGNDVEFFKGDTTRIGFYGFLPEFTPYWIRGRNDSLWVKGYKKGH